MVVEGLFSRRSGPAAALTAAERSPLQGATNWSDFIGPHNRQETEGKEDDKTEKPKPRQIDQNLRYTLVKYAELTQVCYDSFYGDQQEIASFGKAFCHLLSPPGPGPGGGGGGVCVCVSCLRPCLSEAAVPAASGSSVVLWLAPSQSAVRMVACPEGQQVLPVKVERGFSSLAGRNKYPPERLMTETAAVNGAGHFKQYTAQRYLYASSVGLFENSEDSHRYPLRSMATRIVVCCRAAPRQVCFMDDVDPGNAGTGLGMWQ